MRHPALMQQPFHPMTSDEAAQFASLVRAALAEDGASDDVTSSALRKLHAQARADVMVRSHSVVAGLEVSRLAFTSYDGNTFFDALVLDGAVVDGQAVARVRGDAASLLAAERVALNFFGHLSGIATLTHQFVDAVRDLGTKICDTRKTTPGLRLLERYAVRAGGGYNHRFNLASAVLIKDNHIAAAGSVKAAVDAARSERRGDLIIEVECESLPEVHDALACGVDAVLLDNMGLEDMGQAVRLARGKAAVEASGGVTLTNVREIALTGVDVISVGALTHSAPASDVALDFVASPLPANRR